MTALTPGGHVDDAQRYLLESRIATGGMGEVWSARDTVLDRPVAVKVLKAEYADDALFRTRFETEARNAAALHHPGIAAVFDYGQGAPGDGSSTHRPYLVMELVDGQPLSALLRPGAPLDPAATQELLAQAADALGVAHAAGIVHRDVKPANLLVTPDRRIKVTDFGIARAAEGMALTQTGEVMGTPAYISPEQAEGTSATAASDVYSLAVVAFECLAGRKPFVADTPVGTAIAHLRNPVPDLPDTVPADLAAVVRRGMAKSPAERFPDGAAFARALRSPASVTGAGAATVVAPRRRTGAGSTTEVMPAAAPAPHPSRPGAGPRAGARPSSYDAVAAAPRHRGRAGRRAARRLAGLPRRRAHRLDGRQHALAGSVAVARELAEPVTQPVTEPDAHGHADGDAQRDAQRDAERDPDGDAHRDRTGHGRGRPGGLRRARPQGRREGAARPRPRAGRRGAGQPRRPAGRHRGLGRAERHAPGGRPGDGQLLGQDPARPAEDDEGNDEG